MQLNKLTPIFRILRRNMGYMSHRSQYWKDRIGNREMVGYGMNGQPVYIDNVNFPFPAIRYKEITPGLRPLFDKQKCNWRNLSLEEKKALYRLNYCQTFAEFTAPSSGDWMGIVGIGLILVSFGIWIHIFLITFVYDCLPITFKPDRQRAQLKRLLDIEHNPVTGISSKWDYKICDWKEDAWWTPENPYQQEEEDSDEC